MRGHSGHRFMGNDLSSPLLAALDARLRDKAGRARRTDGQFRPFGTSPADALMLQLTKATYGATLALLAGLQKQDLREVRLQFARGGEHAADKKWLAASRVRALALYLVNTALNVEQNYLARAAGITPAAVCLALRRVEDRRDDPKIKALIALAEKIVRGEL